MTCEGRVRHVLCGRGRAHRHGGIRGLGGEALVRGLDVALERGGERRRGDPAADLGTGLRESGDVVDVECSEGLIDPILEAVLSEKFAKSEGSGREAAGNAHPVASELADHLAQRGVLAADLVGVGHPQVVEPDHPFLLFGHGFPACYRAANFSRSNLRSGKNRTARTSPHDAYSRSSTVSASRSANGALPGSAPLPCRCLLRAARRRLR